MTRIFGSGRFVGALAEHSGSGFDAPEKSLMYVRYLDGGGDGDDDRIGFSIDEIAIGSSYEAVGRRAPQVAGETILVDILHRNESTKDDRLSQHATELNSGEKI